MVNFYVYPYSTPLELVTSSAQGNCSSFLKQREAKQLETLQHFDKALICSRFDTIKKFLGILEKKWGHAKWAQKSNILTTCGFMSCRIGLSMNIAFHYTY